MSSLFRRNKRTENEQSQDDDSQGKKKADWKRPASASSVFYLELEMIAYMSLFPLPALAILAHRYRLQAAASQGMAADSHTKDGVTNIIPNWPDICSHRRSLNMGLIYSKHTASKPQSAAVKGANSVVQISQITLDYTDCINAGANFSSSTASFKDMPSSAYSYQLKNPKQTFANPQWSFQALSSSAQSDPTKRYQCRLRFEIPSDLDNPVFLYYKLTNFFQNHRRYVQSLDVDQLKGKAISANDLNNGNCRPLGRDKDDTSKAIYPCGLIANSLFNGMDAPWFIIWHL